MPLKIKKEHYPLLLALSLPILLFIGVWVTNFLPGLFSQPKYNFIYFNARELPYGASSEFYTIDPYTKKIVKDEITFSDYYWKNNPSETISSARAKFIFPTLYLYDVSSKISKPITLEDANNFIIDNSVKSPDGYEITHGQKASFDFIFPNTYTDYSSWVLSKSGQTIDLNLMKDPIKESAYYPSYNVKFLGWIIN